uniref:Outer dynein arm docking complex subunit 1 n=1 Tax=Scophthalmus maximus TaxID=52904 RepID=A0A8D2ZJ04_SCOMX
MPRGRATTSARSNSSEMENDGTESELAKLQRQFRIMEGDRQAYNIQAREQMRKQQQEIDKLMKEQQELSRNLGVSKSLSRQQQDSEETESLRALLEQTDTLEEELGKEKQCQKDLQREISNMELKLVELRRGEVSSSDTQKSEERRTQKAKQTLEYKLDRALTRFNEQLTKNSLLREELQTLHIERARFQQLHNKLEKELQELRKKIGETINLSTAAYDARVEAQSKMTMMREKAVKDLAQYNAEMKDLERVIAHECVLKEFMTTKCNERNDVRRMSELKEQRRMDSEEESLDALEEGFERIKTVTGEDDLDMLVTRFIQGEDQNFALFNFVNVQNNEAEALRNQFNQIQEEMENFRVKGLEQEHDRGSLLRDIDEQKKETESQTVNYENQASIITKILEEIKTGVSSTFSKMDCDRSVIEDMLGFSTGISENHIMSTFNLLIWRSCTYLYLNLCIHAETWNIRLMSMSVLVGFLSVEHDAEDSLFTDEEERPLSQGELRRRIMKGVSAILLE